MDISIIEELINTLGFPIVMVAYFIYDKYHTTSPLIDAINKNTTIMSRLMTKLDAEELLEGGEAVEEG